MWLHSLVSFRFSEPDVAARGGAQTRPGVQPARLRAADVPAPTAAAPADADDAAAAGAGEAARQQTAGELTLARLNPLLLLSMHVHVHVVTH